MALKQLRTHHHEAIRRYIAGESDEEVAEKLGVAVATVCAWRSDPLFKAEIERYQRLIGDEFVKAQARNEYYDPVQEAIKNVALEALEKNIYLMRYAESERVQQGSVWDILDRAGYKYAEKVEQKVTHVIDDKATKDIQQALLDLEKLYTKADDLEARVDEALEE